MDWASDEKSHYHKHRVIGSKSRHKRGYNVHTWQADDDSSPPKSIRKKSHYQNSNDNLKKKNKFEFSRQNGNLTPLM